MIIESVLFGDFLDRENPFSIAREPGLRYQFEKANSAVCRAWWRTAIMMPAPIFVPPLSRMIYRWVGLDVYPATLILTVATWMPLLLILLALATGTWPFWRRHILLRDADTLRATYHERASLVCAGKSAQQG